MHRLKASPTAAGGMELELWRVGPEYSHLVLKDDAVTKVSRIEKLFGSGEYAVLRGEVNGIKRATNRLIPLRPSTSTAPSGRIPSDDDRFRL